MSKRRAAVDDGTRPAATAAVNSGSRSLTAGSLLNACFVSDAEHLIDGRLARLWIHGHTHDSSDYVLNGTRVVCNPRGYVRNGVTENRRFDANFLVEVK